MEKKPSPLKAVILGLILGPLAVAIVLPLALSFIPDEYKKETETPEITITEEIEKEDEISQENTEESSKP